MWRFKPPSSPLLGPGTIQHHPTPPPGLDAHLLAWAMKRKDTACGTWTTGIWQYVMALPKSVRRPLDFCEAKGMLHTM